MATDGGRLEPADMAKVPFLRGLLPAEVEALCAAGRLSEYAAGEFVFRQGDPGREVLVVIAGEVAIELESPPQPPRLLASLRSGSLFGEVNFLLGTERSASARVVRAARVLAFDLATVQGLAGIGRQAAANLMETVARVLALRLTATNRELALSCARLAEVHPEAASALGALDERRQALLHLGEDPQ